MDETTKTETNRIVVSGASGVGKSLWIDPVREKLQAHGYTVDSLRIGDRARAGDDWLQGTYDHREVKRISHKKERTKSPLMVAFLAEVPKCPMERSTIAPIEVFVLKEESHAWSRVSFPHTSTELLRSSKGQSRATHA